MAPWQFPTNLRPSPRIFLSALLFLASCAHAPSSGSIAGKQPGTAKTSAIASYPVPAMHTKIFSTTLPNGLEVYVVPRPDLPLISFRIGLRAGSAEDPPGKGGTASLAASLLERGTKTHDALSIFRTIDSSGGSLEASAGRDMTTVSGDSLTTETPVLLSLASEMIAAPTFPQAEFDQKKANYIASLIDAESHPGPRGTNLFYRLLFGQGPYGHPSSGTAASVKGITRQDLVDFISVHYRPDHSVLVLAGDLTPSEGLSLAKRYFGKWGPISRTGSPPNRPSSLSPRAGVYLINKPELRQSTVFYGTTGIAREDPSFYNALVFDMVLGATNTSTLNRVIRQKMGLVYYIHTGLDAERYPGPFLVNFQTHAPNTAKVIKAMDSVLDKATKTPPSPEKVESVKNELVGGFPFLMNTTSKLASLLLVVWSDNLGLTYFTDYPEKVRQVTQVSALAAGQKLLKGKTFVTVIVGPKKILDKTGIKGQPEPHGL
ncbi:MAG: pitrilysin family protein [Nitrospiraceae bacterium]|nr:pitrilysin family protein [Nitrospiraceae bacterium]